MSARRGLAGAALGVALLTLLGNALGLVRDMVIVAVFGAGAHTDAFVAAWTVPETFSPLLMEGLIPLVLVPYLVRTGGERADVRVFLAKAVWPFVVLSVTIGLTIVAAAPLLVDLLVPGLEQRDLAIACVRLAAGSVPGMALAGIVSATLRSMRVLILPSLVYAAYNIGIISTIVLLSPALGVRAAALGLSLGAILMLVVQLPTFVLRVGIPGLRPVSRAALLQALLVAGPTLGYLIARQGQIFVERFLGSNLTHGSITYLNLAEKLGQVPLTFALAVALVAFPSLARVMTQGHISEARELTTSLLSSLVAIVGPIAAVLMACASPAVSLVFGRGEFTDTGVAETSQALGVYSLGLPAQGVVSIAVLTLFAGGRKTRTPMVWLLVCLVVTLGLGRLLAVPWDVKGLAAANAVGICVAACGLVVHLRARDLVSMRVFRPVLARTLLVAMGTGGAAFLAQRWAVAPVVQLVLAAVAASAIYLLANALMRGQLLRDATEMRRHRY